MPEPKPDARRAYASAPVNQRTAPRPTDKPAPVHASLQARAQKARQRQLLGPPVSELLARGTASVAPAQDKLHPGVIAATVCSVAAACALILLRSGTGLALAAALAALGGAGWLWQHRSQRAAARETMPPTAGPSPFEPEALRRIDDAFDATAAAVPESALAARVLAEEHRLYPAALAWLAEGRVRLEGGRAIVAREDGNPLPWDAALSTPPAQD